MKPEQMLFLGAIILQNIRGNDCYIPTRSELVTATELVRFGHVRAVECMWSFASPEIFTGYVLTELGHKEYAER